MKILIVDDDQDLCQLTRLILTKFGHDVTAFCDPDEGIAHARKSKPNLILMDVMLPGLTGPEIVQQLKDDAQLKDVPVVFLTGLVTGSEQSLQKEGVMVGGIKYPALGKPFEIEKLRDIVQKFAK